eukprot:217859_1
MRMTISFAGHKGAHLQPDPVLIVYGYYKPMDIKYDYKLLSPEMDGDLYFCQQKHIIFDNCTFHYRKAIVVQCFSQSKMNNLYFFSVNFGETFRNSFCKKIEKECNIPINRQRLMLWTGKQLDLDSTPNKSNLEMNVSLYCIGRVEK